MALNFKYTGLVTPDMIRKAIKPCEPIPYRIDTPLHEAILRATKGRGGVAQFMEEAVMGNIEDLDAVLMAAMDAKERQRLHMSRSSTVQINIDAADLLKQAADFLKTKKYSRMGRGSVMIACSILEAEKRKLIGPVEEATPGAVTSTLYNDDPDVGTVTPVLVVRPAKGKPGPKPGAKKLAAASNASKKVPAKAKGKR
jgi:hypothetical protein